MTHENQQFETEHNEEAPEPISEQTPIDGPLDPEPVDAQEAEGALTELKPTIEAIPLSEVRPLRAKMTKAVGIGLTYAQVFAEDRDLFARTFKPQAFDPAEYDDIGERAKAFWQADIQLRQELNAEGPFRSMTQRAKRLRSKLMRAASYLWSDDPDLGEVVSNIRSGRGYANHADDLGALASLFAENWHKAEGKCDVKPEDIDRAKKVGAKFLEMISPTKEQSLEEERILRNKAAEHLRRGIDDIRDAAAYVFREDELMMERYPSLFVHRGRKAKNGKSTPAEGNGDSPSSITDSSTSNEPSVTQESHPAGNDQAFAQQS